MNFHNTSINEIQVNSLRLVCLVAPRGNAGIGREMLLGQVPVKMPGHSRQIVLGRNFFSILPGGHPRLLLIK